MVEEKYGLRITQGSDESEDLICPFCGGANLHHETVTVYDRREDEEEVTVTVVMDGISIVQRTDSEGAGNPSRRRNALMITFSCETCWEIPKLVISQHKGSTFLYWKEG
jgi:hypothetical protein